MHMGNFAAKIVDALDVGVHVLLVDLFPPWHLTIPVASMASSVNSWSNPRRRMTYRDSQPLTLVSYGAGPRVEVYFQHVAVGDSLPEMPLFLRPDR